MGLRRKFSVEYESETSVINYTSDSNNTSFEASTTGYAHEPEYTACELKKLTPADNSDDDDLDSIGKSSLVGVKTIVLFYTH